MHGDRQLDSSCNSPPIPPRHSYAAPPLRMLLDVQSNLNLNQGDAKQLVDSLNQYQNVHGYEPSGGGALRTDPLAAAAAAAEAAEERSLLRTKTSGSASSATTNGSAILKSDPLASAFATDQSLSALTSTMSNITSASGEASISSGERPGTSSGHHHHAASQQQQQQQMQLHQYPAGSALHMSSPNNNMLLQGGASASAGVSNGQLTVVTKRRRNLPGTPDPDAEVIALSPKTLMATNRFVCEICNKGFQRDQNLQLHRRGHNLPWKLKQRTNKEVKKKVYICPEPSCVHHDASRALGDLTGIKKHFCRKHGEKKWKCEKCSKRYAVQSDWKAHSKTCGTREYRCDCGTLFSRRDSFITHRAFCDALAEESARVNTAGGHMMMNSSMPSAMMNQGHGGGPPGLGCNVVMMGSGSNRPPAASPSPALRAAGAPPPQQQQQQQQQQLQQAPPRLGSNISGGVSAASHLMGNNNLMDPHLLAASRTTAPPLLGSNAMPPHDQLPTDSLHGGSGKNHEQHQLLGGGGANSRAPSNRLSLWPPASTVDFPFMGSETQLSMDSLAALHRGGGHSHSHSHSSGNHNMVQFDHNLYEPKPLSSHYNSNMLQMSSSSSSSSSSSAAAATNLPAFMSDMAGFPGSSTLGGLSSDQFAGLSSFANRQLNSHLAAAMGGSLQQGMNQAAAPPVSSLFNLQSSSANSSAQMSATALLQKAAQMGASASSENPVGFLKGLAGPDYSSMLSSSASIWGGSSSSNAQQQHQRQGGGNHLNVNTNNNNNNMLGRSAGAAAGDHHHLMQPPAGMGNHGGVDHLSHSSLHLLQQSQQHQRSGGGPMNSAASPYSFSDHELSGNAMIRAAANNEYGSKNSAGMEHGMNSSGLSSSNTQNQNQNNHQQQHHRHHQQQQQQQQQQDQMVMMSPNSSGYNVNMQGGGSNLNRLFNVESNQQNIRGMMMNSGAMMSSSMESGGGQSMKFMNGNVNVNVQVQQQAGKVPKSEDGVTRDFLGVQLVRPAMIQQQQQQQQQIMHSHQNQNQNQNHLHQHLYSTTSHHHSSPHHFSSLYSNSSSNDHLQASNAAAGAPHPHNPSYVAADDQRRQQQ